MKEIWKDVADYEGLYIVSNYGNVANIKYDNRSPRLLKRFINGSGYYYVSLRKDGENRNMLIHRLVAASFIPNPENKPQVNHKDGNKLNPRADNLEWVTALENHEHAEKMGLIDYEYNRRCFAAGFDAYLEKIGKKKCGWFFDLNYTTELDIILRLFSESSPTDYIKRLIRRDIEEKNNV